MKGKETTLCACNVFGDFGFQVAPEKRNRIGYTNTHCGFSDRRVLNQYGWMDGWRIQQFNVLIILVSFPFLLV